MANLGLAAVPTEQTVGPADLWADGARRREEA